MCRSAGERGRLPLFEPDVLAVDDEVNRPLEHRGDLVLGVLVVLPARAGAVAVERRGQLRRVDGRPVDVGADLLELLLVNCLWLAAGIGVTSAAVPVKKTSSAM